MRAWRRLRDTHRCRTPTPRGSCDRARPRFLQRPMRLATSPSTEGTDLPEAPIIRVRSGFYRRGRPQRIGRRAAIARAQSAGELADAVARLFSIHSRPAPCSAAVASSLSIAWRNRPHSASRIPLMVHDLPQPQLDEHVEDNDVISPTKLRQPCSGSGRWNRMRL